jgi:spermidine/putrescine transport system substrate-binding protein
MRRRTLLGGVAGLAGTAACGPARDRLNVFNWSDYVAVNTIANFEREAGLRVRYGTYESVQEMLAKVMSGNSGWDVVFPSAEYIQAMRQMDLLAPLNHDWLPGLDQLEPAFQRPPWDPELEWSVPYMHGTTGVVYQRELGITRWDDLWAPRMAGRVTMLDDGAEVVGVCLMRLGFSLNSGDAEELRAAQKEAIEQKRLVRAYINAEVADQVVAGDVVAAQAWTTTVGRAMAAAQERLAFALPEEGFARYCDSAAILKESGRKREAHRFLDYLLRPTAAEAVAREMRTATCNAGARALLPMELREDAVLYPAEETLARGEWFTPQSAASQRLRDRLWTEIKSA